MKRSLRAIGLLLALLFLFPTLSASAGATRPLSPQNDAPTAWLSAREGSSLGKHDLRVVLVIPKATDPDEVTLSLTFEGENAPASLSKTLSELTLYRTLRAGGSVYSAADGSTMRVLTLTDLKDASYTSLSLTLNQGESVLYTATQTAQNLGDSTGLLLTPWNHSLTDWMSSLPDSRSLAEITIPGTHDSGATVNNSLSKCQNLSIAEQLSIGVRFLDIRLKLQNDQLNVYHGIISQKLNFTQVMESCTSFLSEHPDEVILMSIKQEDDNNAGFPAAIANVIAQNPDLWYTANKLPTLGEVRGKIVLIRRYTDASIGINCANGWADNTNFSMNNGVSMKVQDYYNVGSSSNLNTKWDKIVALANDASKSDKTFCINFTSGYTSTSILGISIPNITAASNNINPTLLTHFEGLPQGGYGTYPIDFITPEIASALIATNFPR